MIRHVVMFKLNEFDSNIEKQKIISEIKNRLENLPELISEIKYYEVGVNLFDSPVTNDIVLISDFESNQTLNSYRIHLEHQNVVDFIAKYKSSGSVVDYEY